MGSTEKCVEQWKIIDNKCEKKCIYEGVIVPTALYGAESWGMRSAERRKVNVFVMTRSRSLVGVSRMDKGMRRCVGEDEYRMARRVLIAHLSGGRPRLV